MFVFQSVIDGDLCEYFNSLDSSKRRSIAEELDRTPAEVKSKLCHFLKLKGSRLFRSETTCKLIVFLRSSLSTDLFVWQVSKKLEDIRTRYAF